MFEYIHCNKYQNFNKFQPSYKFTSHIHVAAFLSVVLITEMLEICKQKSYDQNVQLILKSYLPVVYGTPLSERFNIEDEQFHQYQQNKQAHPSSYIYISFIFIIRKCYIFNNCYNEHKQNTCLFRTQTLVPKRFGCIVFRRLTVDILSTTDILNQNYKEKTCIV